MAEPRTQEIANRMERLLECPICLSQYQTPKVLPCQHTFCQACMIGLLDDAKIKCPSCRRKHDVPASGIQGFPPNVTITELIDLQEAAQRKQNNSSADVEKEIEHLTKSMKVLKGIADVSELTRTLEARSSAIQDEIGSVFSGYRDLLSKREVQLKNKAIRITEAALEEYASWEKKVEREMNGAVVLLEEMKDEQTESGNASLDTINRSATASVTLLKLVEMQPTSPEFHFAFGRQSIVTHMSDFGSVDLHRPLDLGMQRQLSQLISEPSVHPLSVDYYPSHKPFSVAPTQDDEQFSPFGLSTAPSGKIIVTDIENHHVHIFDPDLKLLNTFGELGDSDGKFNRPTGVAVNSLGQIVVADQLNNRVEVFNEQGAFQFKFGQKGDVLGEMLYPCGLDVDRGDKIYVCDSGNFRIQVFNPRGKPLYFCGDRDQFVNQPHFIAVTVDERILVSDSKQYIRVFKGQHELYKLYMSQPTGLAVDRLGNIVVGHSSGHLVVLRDTGEAICHIGTCGKGPGLFILPRAIAITEQGKIVVADSAAHMIQMFAVNFTQQKNNNTS